MFEDMDPSVKYWMYNNWVEDFEDNHKMLENIAYLIGSFINPELVQKVLGKSGQTFESDDEDFDATSKAILENIKAEEEKAKKPKKKRKKRIEEQ